GRVVAVGRRRYVRRRGQHGLDDVALGRAEIALARTAGVARLDGSLRGPLAGIEVGIGVVPAATSCGEQRDDGEGEQAAFHREAPVEVKGETCNGVRIDERLVPVDDPSQAMRPAPVCPRSRWM